MSQTEVTSTLFCSFCAKSQHEIRKLIAGPSPSIFICDECVGICADLINESSKEGGAKFQLSPNAEARKKAEDELRCLMESILRGEAARHAQYVALREAFDRWDAASRLPIPIRTAETTSST